MNHFEFRTYKYQANAPKTTLGSQAATNGLKLLFMENTEENLPTKM